LRGGRVPFQLGAVALLLSDLTPTVYQGALIYASDGMINMTASTFSC
jgi:hypothetical protein